MKRGNTIKWNNNIDFRPNWAVRCIPIICIVFIGVAWGLRYYTLNKFFLEHFSYTITRYEIGDMVALGENNIIYDKAPGYCITILNAKILPYKAFLDTLPEDEIISVENPPEYIMDITANIFNSGSKVEGVYLPDFILHSYDMYTDTNYPLMSVVNPILEENSYGISLAKNTDFTVRLIFNLRKEHLSTNAFENIEEYPFFLRLTSYPNRQEVKIQ